MKKKSLQEIKKQGWSISGEDQEKIAARKSTIDLTAAAGEISAAVTKIAAIAASAQKDKAQSMDRLETLLQMQAVMFQKLTEQIDAQRPDPNMQWEFNVRRNNGGFISKIHAKKITA
jgi:thioredoxin-like negative regulator of GroEL